MATKLDLAKYTRKSFRIPSEGTDEYVALVKFAGCSPKAPGPYSVAGFRADVNAKADAAARANLKADGWFRVGVNKWSRCNKRPASVSNALKQCHESVRYIEV